MLRSFVSIRIGHDLLVGLVLTLPLYFFREIIDNTLALVVWLSISLIVFVLLIRTYDRYPVSLKLVLNIMGYAAVTVIPYYFFSTFS